jgi:hypothetical protein
MGGEGRGGRGGEVVVERYDAVREERGRERKERRVEEE